MRDDDTTDRIDLTPATREGAEAVLLLLDPHLVWSLCFVYRRISTMFVTLDVASFRTGQLFIEKNGHGPLLRREGLVADDGAMLSGTGRALLSALIARQRSLGPEQQSALARRAQKWPLGGSVSRYTALPGWAGRMERVPTTGFYFAPSPLGIRVGMAIACFGPTEKWLS